MYSHEYCADQQANNQSSPVSDKDIEWQTFNRYVCTPSPKANQYIIGIANTYKNVHKDTAAMSTEEKCQKEILDFNICFMSYICVQIYFLYP
jgi:hypothetical protein